MAWTSLETLVVSDETHNPDVVEAIAMVRSVVRGVRVAYLDPHAVTVDVDPEYRAAKFSLPHAAEPGSSISFWQGDGYTHFSCPIAEYHGYLEDHELAGLLRAALTGGLVRVRRFRAGALIEDRSRWLVAESQWNNADAVDLLVRRLAACSAGTARRLRAALALVRSCSCSRRDRRLEPVAAA